jgi:hypothetical protein
MKVNEGESREEYAVPRLLTVRQFLERHAWATKGGIRHLIFNEYTNGFDKVVRRMGRRVLIDEAKFFEWLEEQNAEFPHV